MNLVSSSPTICDIRDLRDGSAVDQVLLVREREIRRTRAGADYMRLRSPTAPASSPRSCGTTSTTPPRPRPPASRSA